MNTNLLEIIQMVYGAEPEIIKFDEELYTTDLSVILTSCVIDDNSSTADTAS